MKTILLSLCLLVTAMNANANIISPNTDDPKVEMTKQLSSIVASSSIWNETTENQKLVVSFMINESGEVVVLSTDNNKFDYELKSLLNYRKMDVNPALMNKIFHLPIRIESKL